MRAPAPITPPPPGYYRLIDRRFAATFLATTDRAANNITFNIIPGRLPAATSPFADVAARRVLDARLACCARRCASRPTVTFRVADSPAADAWHASHKASSADATLL